MGMSKKTSRISFFVLVILILIVIVLPGSALYFFARADQQVPKPVYSADRSRVIIPSVNFNKDNNDSYLLVNIEVQDTSKNKTLFQVQTRASDRMRWFVKWIGNDMVMLESSDIGSYCWSENNSGAWQEIKCP
jgi:hypothetical protein